MRSKSSVASILVVSLLAACATSPELRQSGGRAIAVTIVRKSPTPVAVATYADDLDCYGRKAVGLPDSPDITLSAPDKPWQTFEFGIGHFSTSVVEICQGVASFRTDAAHEYKVEFDEIGGARCSMHVMSRAVGSHDAMAEVEVEPREKTTPFIDSAGPWCKANAKFRGSSNYAAPRQ